MDEATLIAQAKKIINRYQGDSGAKLYSKAREFLRIHAGEKSTFFEMIERIRDREMYESEKAKIVYDQMEAFIEYVESGLFRISTITAETRMEVIYDFLNRAKAMLKNDKIYPGSVAVLIGSVFENYLQHYTEEKNLKIPQKKKNIAGFVQSLKNVHLASKQDVDEIMHWGSLYEKALRGEWDEVADRKRVFIMVEGILLFIRKNT